jgi:hypothetical protein
MLAGLGNREASGAIVVVTVLDRKRPVVYDRRAWDGAKAMPVTAGMPLT